MAERRISRDHFLPPTATSRIPGPTPAFAAGESGTTSGIVPSSFTTKPIEKRTSVVRSASSRALWIALGVSDQPSFQPAAVMPPRGAEGDVDWTRSVQNFFQS
jgi:hypothetical protein